MRISADVAIVGSGFGGSLAALVLNRLGLKVVLLERGQHPRFAIGESSTPLANLALRDLARKYDLPRLEPLARYGTWKAAHPDVVCGMKRGFSYFKVPAGVPFTARADHSNELLVAASATDEIADTHWLRSDFDHFLVREVESCGIPYLDRADLAGTQEGGEWVLEGRRLDQPLNVRSKFLIDGTGDGGFVGRILAIAAEGESLQTKSRGLFAHFTGLKPWAELYGSGGGRIQDHPFDCDRSALHVVIEEGWMWQLRFDNGVTSAGFALDMDYGIGREGSSPQDEWDGLMRKYPSLAAQFEGTRVVQPVGGLVRTGRLQRLASQCAGENWAMLPHSAGFIDPFYSSGIAHTLCGIERLGALFAGHWGSKSLKEGLAEYDWKVRHEIRHVDRLVHLWYANRDLFECAVASNLLHFAGATWSEHRRVKGLSGPGAAFLSSAHDGWLEALRAGIALIDEYRARSAERRDTAELTRELGIVIKDFNVAGLCDPGARNMYRWTALPEE